MDHITVTTSAYPKNKEIALISVKGFMDTNTAPEFEKVFQTVLGQKKFNLIIDLKETNYISSAGWGIFIGEIKRIRSQKGNLFLAGMNPEVEDAYELLEFDSIIKAFPDVDQAAQSGFGKSLAGKAPAKSRSQKAAPAPLMSKGFEQPRMVVSLEQAQGAPAPSAKKSSWLGKILLPWRWF